MSTNTSETDNDGRTETELNSTLTRRKLLRRGGGAAGALAVGGAASGLGPLPKLSPIGNSRAFPCGGACVAGGLALIGGAAVAGTIIGYSVAENDADIDNTSENEVHSTASGIASQRETIRSTAQSDIIEPAPDKTTLADAMWSSAETTAAKKLFNEEGGAEAAALRAIDRRKTMALHTAFQNYRLAFYGGPDVDALITPLVQSYSTGTDQFKIGGSTSDTVSPVSGGSFSKFSAVDSSEIYTEKNYPSDEINPPDPKTDKYMLFEHEWTASDMPRDPATIEGIKAPIKIPYLATDDSGAAVWGPSKTSVPSLPTSTGNIPLDGLDQWTKGSDLHVSHPNRSAVHVIDTKLWKNYFQAIEDTTQEIKSQMKTHIKETLKPGIEQGAIEPQSVIDGEELISRFSDADGRARAAAAAAAVGYKPPENMGQQVKISHQDLIENRWVDLYIRTTKTKLTISKGDTIEASEYKSAYAGFTHSADDGTLTTEYKTVLLDGNSPIEILDLEGETQIYQRRMGQPDGPISEESPEDIEERLDTSRETEKEIRDAMQSGGGLGGAIGNIGSGIKRLVIIAVVGLIGLAGLNAASD